MIETFGGQSTAEQAREQAGQFAEKVFGAAQPGAVFGAPVVSGAYTIISASAVAAGGGWGFGAGPTAEGQASGGETQATGSGGGGGGGSAGRPIAAIVIGPDGVTGRPIVDATKIALAAIAAWGSVGFLALRLARRRRRPAWATP